MKYGIKTHFAVALTVLISLFSVVITAVFLMQSASTRDDMLKAVQSASSKSMMSQARTHNEKLAQFIADQLTNPLYFHDLEVVSKFTISVLEQEDIEYIYVFDANGSIIHDGTETLEAFGLVVDNAGFHHVLSAGTVFSRVTGLTLHTTVPMKVGNKLLGGVQIGLSLADIDSSISNTEAALSAIHEESDSQLIRSTVLLVVIATAFGVILSIATFRRTVNTIETLSRTMLNIGQRNYDVNSLAPMVKRNDELGDLCVSVERMSRALAENEEKLRSALEVAQSANDAKSKFLSSMSHELRTPLNAVVGFAQVLEYNKKNLDEKQIKSVQQILKGSEHLLVLINELLDLASIETGEIKLDVTSLQPNLIVDQCLQMAVSMGAKYGVEIDKKTNAENMPEIKVDPMRFKQVLLNLLSNAVKYNRVGGRVTLTCAETRNAQVRFYISDTGEGIPEELHHKLFAPFDRLGRENMTIEGTGIGLAITRELVALMGGEIGLVSELGKGSTFWVEFPTSGRDAVSPNVATDEELTSPSGKSDQDLGVTKVLYVEDNPDNRDLMEVIIDDIGGIQLICTETAEEGLIIAEQERPALILMDINLPGMSGLDALRELQKQDTTRNITVIAISAHAMEKDINAGLAAGFKAYLTKPFDVMELHSIIAEELKTSSLSNA